jgi:adenine-specific DNA-methyltransferase
LVYAKSPEKFKSSRNRIELDEAQAKIYRNPDNPKETDPAKRWRGLPMTAQGWRPNQMYTITAPNGRNHVPPDGRCWSTIEPEYLKLREKGRIYWGKDGNAQPSVIRFLSEVEGLVPWTWWGHEEVGHTDEAKKEANVLFGGDVSFGTPKPERLMQRILHIATNPNDLILDSFLGSGTTAAVAHKMGRRWIGIEMGEHAATHCLPRLQKVIEGEQGGISRAVGWAGGGGFRFMRLGETVFDDAGRINPAVRFATLAAFIWQQETGTAFDPKTAKPGTPYLGTYYVNNSELSSKYVGYVPILSENETKVTLEAFNIPKMGIYLLFNGILGDKRPAGGNVLTRDVLAAARVTFKQIPYDVRAR